MDGNDRQAIATLFDRLAEAERQSPPRDPEAEAFIRDNMSQQPGAPYYLAQTVIVQQQALEAAQERIAELESRAGNAGGIFGALFGGGARPAAAPRQAYQQAQRGRQAWAGHGSTAQGAQQGGSFLGGAAQTAMGVAGGVLLGKMLAGALFGGNEAQAAEAPPEDAGGDDFGDFDGGGDFGDF